MTDEATGEGVEGVADQAIAPLELTSESAAITSQLDLTLDEGRVWRWSRTELHLDSRQREAVDRAISVAEERGLHADEAADADSIKAFAEAMRADGFEDHLTHEGFLKVTVWAARTGVQRYGNGVTEWGELRSAEEVGAAASLETWGLKPVTDDHPPGLVAPASYTAFTKGSCGEDAALSEPADDGHQYVQLTILVGDLALLRKIRDGKVELSAGYTVVAVEEPGTDFDGQDYKFLQTDIRINHLAVVDAGRAGPLARISVDGAWEIVMSTDTDKKPHADNAENLRTMIGAAWAMGEALRANLPEVSEAAIEQAGALALGAMAGEISEELVAVFAETTGMDPAVVAELVMKPSAEPAPELPEDPETPEPEPEEENMETPQNEEMVEVELSDGLTVKVSKDDAEAIEASRAKEQADAAAAKEQADAAAALEQERIAADAAKSKKIDDLERTVADLKSDAADRARDALIAEASAVSPMLGEKWAKDVREGADVPSPTEMKLAVIVDLDPSAKGELERVNADSRDATVATVYRMTVARAAERKQDSAHIKPAVVLDEVERLLLESYGQKLPN